MQIYLLSSAALKNLKEQTENDYKDPCKDAAKKISPKKML